MDVPKPPTVPFEQECPCMSMVRKRNEQYFKNANKEITFHYPEYEINEDYFRGYCNFPTSRVFTYRNVYGGLSHDTCKCSMLNWKETLPKDVQNQMLHFAYWYRKRMEPDLCRCGKHLMKLLEKQDKDGIVSHYCRTVPVTPPRYIYRRNGVLQSMLCTCINESTIEPIEESSESESESDDEEYE